MLDPYLPEGVSIEWTNLRSNDDIRDAVATGRIDISSVSMTTIISAIENEFPLMIISSSFISPSYFYSNNDLIKEFKDINTSARIAIESKGGIIHTALMLEFFEVFGNYSSYNSSIFTMPNAEMLASLANTKDIDCAVVSFPNNIVADNMNNLTMFDDLTYTMEKHGLISCFITSQLFYKEKPYLIDAFRRASLDAVKFINDNPVEASELLANDYGVEPVHIENIFRKYPARLEIRGYDEIADLMLEYGILSKPAGKFSALPNYNDIPKY